MRLKQSSLLFMFLMFVGSDLSAQEILDRVVWGDVTVVQDSVSEPRRSYGDIPVRARLIFYKGKKRIHEEPFIHEQKIGFLKTHMGKLLTAEGYSGGESGCCEYIQVFYRTAKGVKSLDAVWAIGQASAPLILDLDGDGIDEIRTDSEKWYRVSTLLKGQETCEANLMPGSYMGMSSLRVPVYQQVRENKKGEFVMKDVTFSPWMRVHLESEMKEARKALSKLKRNLVAYESPDLGGLFQYLDYETQLGRRSEALDLIKRMNFKISYQCDRFGKEHSESLIQFLNHDWTWKVEADF